MYVDIDVQQIAYADDSFGNEAVQMGQVTSIVLVCYVVYGMLGIASVMVSQTLAFVLGSSESAHLQKCGINHALSSLACRTAMSGSVEHSDLCPSKQGGRLFWL